MRSASVVAAEMVGKLDLIRRLAESGEEGWERQADFPFAEVLMLTGELGQALAGGMFDVRVAVDAKPARPILKVLE